MMICKNCGFSTDAAMKFCPECGTKLEIPAPVTFPIPAGYTQLKDNIYTLETLVSDPVLGISVRKVSYFDNLTGLTSEMNYPVDVEPAKEDSAEQKNDNLLIDSVMAQQEAELSAQPVVTNAFVPVVDMPAAFAQPISDMPAAFAAPPVMSKKMMKQMQKMQAMNNVAMPDMTAVPSLPMNYGVPFGYEKKPSKALLVVGYVLLAVILCVSLYFFGAFSSLIPARADYNGVTVNDPGTSAPALQPIGSISDPSKLEQPTQPEPEIEDNLDLEEEEKLKLEKYAESEYTGGGNSGSSASTTDFSPVGRMVGHWFRDLSDGSTEYIIIEGSGSNYNITVCYFATEIGFSGKVTSVESLGGGNYKFCFGGTEGYFSLGDVGELFYSYSGTGSYASYDYVGSTAQEASDYYFYTHS